MIKILEKQLGDESTSRSRDLIGSLGARAILMLLIGIGSTNHGYAAKNSMKENLPRLGDGKKHTDKEVPSAVRKNPDDPPSDERKEVHGGNSVNSVTDAQTWSSSGQSSAPSAASEITKGVRVEDIVEPPADYHYASFGKPDPFIPPLMPEALAKAKNPGPSSIEIPIVSALQRYSIDKLSIVGIWQHSNGDRKALVLTPSEGTHGGQGVIVKAGDPIGDRGGKILAIGNDFIAVREFFLTQDGVRQYEDRRMLMVIKPPEHKPAHLLFKPGSRTASAVSDDRDVSDGHASEMPTSTTDSKAGIEQPLRNTGVQSSDLPQSSPGFNDPSSLILGQPNGTTIPAGDSTQLSGTGQPVAGVMNSASQSDFTADPQSSGTGTSSAAPPPAVGIGSGGINQSVNGSSPGSVPSSQTIENQPLLNGMPIRYVGGAMGTSGSEITQPASSSIPPR